MDKRTALKHKLEDVDNTPLGFGKYRGKTPEEVSDINPNYILWMWDKFDDPPCSEALYNFCVRDAAKWSKASGD